MPAARAHLLLPTPLGLVHYDLLEDAAFLGVSTKGQLSASPSPFREAKLAITHDGAGFVAKALPGEAPADVNGAPGDGARLRDGDRIRLGEQVALFRSLETPAGSAIAAPLPPAGATAEAPEAPRPRRAAAPMRILAPKGARQAATVLSLAGASGMLLAAYQAVHYLATPGADQVPHVTASMLDSDAPAVARVDEKAAEAYDAAAAYEHEHPEDLAGAVDRYRAVAREFDTSLVAARATARVSEAWPVLATREWDRLKMGLPGLLNMKRYRQALEGLALFESRFAGTEPSAAVREAVESVRTTARAALDAVKQRAAPFMTTDPTRAYRVLTTADLELPADLDAEMAAMMHRVRELWGTPPPQNGERPEPGASTGAPGQPPTKGKFPGPLPGPGTGPGVGPEPGSSGHEPEARAMWLQAKADLSAKRWESARHGYSQVLKQFADTLVVKDHMDALKAGRQAANVALKGAAGLLKEEATMKDGRLEVEYQFDEDKTFLSDFDVEQAFVGDEPQTAEIKSGMCILSGSTAALLRVVFDPTDVTWEMDARADEHRDYGLYALQEGKDYRALAMEVGNTQFKLKKGAEARVLGGHVLWLFGDGVWKQADPGERGFVKIAEKRGNGLKSDEMIKVRVEILKGQVAGEIHAKSEGVDLRGPLKGDDGVGMGPLRVGAFAYKGRVGVDRLKVSGKVDAAWLEKIFLDLVKAATGPDDK